MSSAREKFRDLLRELFQFDCADLDFGIYRVMNYKRDVIETFITDALPRAVADELQAGGSNPEAREAAVYNHLYAFFSRYYHDGDFISKRRYSKRQRYAIPYNGEEVYLHWANGDQHYVKSDDHFRDYAFTRDGITVRFTVRDADVEQNDVWRAAAVHPGRSRRPLRRRARAASEEGRVCAAVEGRDAGADADAE